MPAVSAFAKNDTGEVCHSYSAFARGCDTLVTPFNFLDSAPKGRNESGGTMSWARLHDAYDDADLLAETTRRDPDLLITRGFGAPLELVWRAWSEPEHLVNWFFPDACRAVDPRFDVRPGGAYRYTFHGDDGVVHRLRGTFREIAPHERLVFTFGWANEDELVEEDSLVTVTFKALGERTQVTVWHVGVSSADDRRDHAEGWNQALDHLATLLASNATERP